MHNSEFDRETLLDLKQTCLPKPMDDCSASIRLTARIRKQYPWRSLICDRFPHLFFLSCTNSVVKIGMVYDSLSKRQLSKTQHIHLFLLERACVSDCLPKLDVSFFPLQFQKCCDIAQNWACPICACSSITKYL